MTAVAHGALLSFAVVARRQMLRAPRRFRVALSKRNATHVTLVTTNKSAFAGTGIGPEKNQYRFVSFATSLWIA